MTNPTSNYGFVLPTSSDLVTDLPADFDVALQGVDTRLKALQPGTTLGDIAYSSATANTNTRLAVGTNGQVLAVAGGVPVWTTTADVTPLTTKGDLFTFDTADARLGVGTNGQTLVADSTASTGLKWATASSGGMTLLASGSISGASVDLTSISGSYTDLVVQYSGVNWATSDDYLIMRFNGNTGTDYATFLQATKLNVSLFYGAIDAARILIYPGENWSRTGANMFTFRIPDYASTLSRHLIAGTIEGTPTSGTGYKVLGTFAGATYSSSAITQITLSTQTGLTFNGGTYKLWGVK